MIVMHTTLGSITLELDSEHAPKTVANFIAYVEQAFYNDTLFHRVIDSFMIQGGGFTAGMQQKPVGDPIANEADNGLKNEAGTIAMARTGDPHSATAQFFINVQDNDFLNYRAATDAGWGYTVFGKVVQGMEVVNKIKDVPTTSADGHRDVPIDDIVIKSVETVA